MIKRELRSSIPDPDPVTENFTGAAVSSEPFSAIPDFAARQPSYYPTHPSLQLSAETANLTPIKFIEERLGAVKKAADKFLKYLLQNPHLFTDENANSFLEKQAETYATLLRQKAKLAVFQTTLRKEHMDIVEGRRFLPDVTLAMYDASCEVQKPNFGDAISASLDAEIANEKAIDSMLEADTDWQYLRHAAFILRQPEDALPDDSKDDELAVAGGKIPLKDPLSMDFFREPVMSKKCKHVFEKTHIESQLKGRHQVIHCPIPGCSSQVSPSDLQHDKLMDLRVKVFQATEKKREQRVRI